MTDNIRTATVRWRGEGLQFEGSAGDAASIILDGDSQEGPSPMEALLLSLGGCMAIDIQVILQKGRVPLEALEVEMQGERVPDSPKRFSRIHMRVGVKGPTEEDLGKVKRAIELSRDKYCSVFHTLRPDLDFETSVALD